MWWLRYSVILHIGVWQDRCRCRWPVTQRAVEPELVVVLPPSLDQHFRLLQRIEDLAIEQLILNLAVERLVVAVLPW